MSGRSKPTLAQKLWRRWCALWFRADGLEKVCIVCVLIAEVIMVVQMFVWAVIA